MPSQNNGIDFEVRRLENLLRRTNKANITINNSIPTIGTINTQDPEANSPYTAISKESTQYQIAGAVQSTANALSLINYDAFQRLRVSNPTTLFDSQNTLTWKTLGYGRGDNTETNSDLAWSNYSVSQTDEETNGTGNVYYFNSRGSVGVFATGNSVTIRQTKQRFRYQPGKSQLIFITFREDFPVEQGEIYRIGYFDDNAGMFFQTRVLKFITMDNYEVQNSFVIRSKIPSFGSADSTAELIDHLVLQSDWNLDKLDGTGASGYTLDNESAQIFFIDFEWLGAGTVAFGFVINRQMVYCHYAHHANQIGSVYTQTPNLPIRYEVRNPYGVNADTWLEAICSSVISEGGFDEGKGFPQSFSTDTTEIKEEKTILILRPSLNPTPKLNDIPRGMNLLLEGIETSSTQAMIIRVYFVHNTTAGISGGTWAEVLTSGINPGSLCDYNLTGTPTANYCTLIYTFYTSAGTTKNINIQKSFGFSGKLPLGHFVYNDSTKKQESATGILITAQPVSTTGALYLALNWKEIY